MNWISVKDRVPPNDEWVLVYSPRDDFITIGYYDKHTIRGYYEDDGRYISENSGWDIQTPWAPKGPPTHWMPLPELPKE